MIALKYHHRRKIRWHRLPFVQGKCHWAVPATGGHLGGMITGEALAIAYLKFLRESPTADSCIDNLHMVVDAMYGQDGIPENTVENKSRCGQRAGFFFELTRFLWLMAQYRATPLDAVSEAMILKKANLGLQYKTE